MDFQQEKVGNLEVVGSNPTPRYQRELREAGKVGLPLRLCGSPACPLEFAQVSHTVLGDLNDTININPIMLSPATIKNGIR